MTESCWIKAAKWRGVFRMSNLYQNRFGFLLLRIKNNSRRLFTYIINAITKKHTERVQRTKQKNHRNICRSRASKYGCHFFCRLEIFKLNLRWHSINITAIAVEALAKQFVRRVMGPCPHIDKKSPHLINDTICGGLTCACAHINFIYNGCNNVSMFLMGCISCMADSIVIQRIRNNVCALFGAILNCPNRKSLYNKCLLQLFWCSERYKMFATST